MEKIPSEVGLHDNRGDVPLTPGSSVVHTTFDTDYAGDDPRSVLDTDAPNPGVGDSSSCHNDVTVIQQKAGTLLESLTDNATKDGVYHQVYGVLRGDDFATVFPDDRKRAEIAGQITERFIQAHRVEVASHRICVDEIASFTREQMQKALARRHATMRPERSPKAPSFSERDGRGHRPPKVTN